MKYNADVHMGHARGESPPSRGAWIEIYRIRRYPPKADVAPLAGGVD